MGTVFQAGSLKHQVLSHYLFDQNFNLQGKEGDAGVSDVIKGCLEGIRKIVNPEHPELAEREWNVQLNATPFEKLQAAFNSVRGEMTQDVTASQRGDLVGYYRMLRNEQLKESRLFLWEYLVGYEGNPHAGRAFIEENKLSECTGNEVAEKFQSWLQERPDILKADRILLMISKSEFHLTHLPPEIGLLTELRSLTICFTHLEEVPPEIGNLTKLRKLSLIENRLKRLPDEIGELTALKFLKLDGNPLQELPPSIGRLKLEILSLPQHLGAEVNDGVKCKESAG